MIKKQDTMDLIDKAAINFYKTKDKKYFDEYAKHAVPVIRRFVNNICMGSRWDADELFSILLSDMWRLFNKYKPEKEKKFHWLMLRQLRNKSINYIHQVEGRVHKICPVCGKKKEETNDTGICSTCRSPLRISDKVIVEPFESSCACTPDYLKEFANKDLVRQLMQEVKGDPKTHKILAMLLEGETKSAISREVKIAQNALNNRITKCQKIVKRLLCEKFKE